MRDAFVHSPASRTQKSMRRIFFALAVGIMLCAALSPVGAGQSAAATGERAGSPNSKTCAAQLSEARLSLQRANDALMSAKKSVRKLKKPLARAKKALKKAKRTGDKATLKVAKAKLRKVQKKQQVAKQRVRKATDRRVRAQQSVASAMACVSTDATTLRLVVNTPEGVPANVRIVGPENRVFGKPDAGTTISDEIELPVGTYTVSAEPTVSAGRFYIGTTSQDTVVVGSGKPTVTITYAEVATARDPHVSAITSTTASITWTSPGAVSPVAVRRTIGAEPAASLSEGVAVPVAGNAADDTGLVPATTYTYALFTTIAGNTFGPMSVSVGTQPEEGSGGGEEGKPEVFQAGPSTVLAAQPERYPAVESPAGYVITWPSGETPPVAGTPVVLPASAGFPSGLIGIVSSVGLDGRTVELVPGAMGDAFDLYAISVPVLDLVPIDTVDDPTAGAAARTIGAARAQGAARAAGLSFSCKKADGVDVSLNADVNFSAPEGKWDAGINRYNVLGVGVPSGAWWDMELVFPVDIPVTASATGKAKCTAEFKRSWTRNLGWMPLAIKLQLKAEVSLGASIAVKGLEFSTRGGFSSDTSFDIASRRFTSTSSVIREFDAVAPSELEASAAIDAQLSGTLAVGPGAATSKVDSGVVGGLRGTIKFLDANAELTASTGSNPICATIAAGGSADLDLVVQAWFSPKNKWLPDFDFEAKTDLLESDWKYVDPAISRPKNCDKPPPLMVSSAGDPWSDEHGESGTAELTYGHVACEELDGYECHGGSSNWPNLIGAPWIWSSRIMTPGQWVVTFTKSVSTESGQYVLRFCADDSATLVVDGQELGFYVNPERVSCYEEELDLDPGVHVFEFEVTNNDWIGVDPWANPGGLAYRLDAAV